MVCVSPALAESRMDFDGTVEDSVMEVSGFAVSFLKDATEVHELPTWRSLGV